jgi:hypothetical protein
MLSYTCVRVYAGVLPMSIINTLQRIPHEECLRYAYAGIIEICKVEVRKDT